MIFFKWLDEWEAEVQEFDYPAARKNEMLISRETLTEIRMTGKTYILHCTCMFIQVGFYSVQAYHSTL